MKIIEQKIEQSPVVAERRDEGTPMKVADFRAIRLKLASPDDILNWSFGEVLKPETINYRTQKPEKDGLFSERIFGPTKDYECYCGKYKRIRYKGVICDKCGVEVTRAAVRRERMGHIKLAAPVAHIWFLRGVPSRIGSVLGMPLNQLERVIYYASYVITEVDDEAKKQVLEEIEREYAAKLKGMGRAKDIKITNKERTRLQDSYKLTRDAVGSIKPGRVLSENEYYILSERYGHIFEAAMGAEPIKKFLEEIDLRKLNRDLAKQIKNTKGAEVWKLVKRLRLVRSMIKAGVRPEWMFITALPVLPPDLRPMVQLDGGRYASSDLNDLYRRVINRNNRLKRLLEIRAPEVIVRNEKRMLQEAVDSLVDNSIRHGRGTQTAVAMQRRPLKSLADMLKGKQGRFRQNLLGKRVDYSGRSVIVIGPDLKLGECGLPKKMALEIFKPFVIRELLAREAAHNMKGASRLIEDAPPIVWEILEEVIRGKYVFLNRAPTLHRLSVQAFQPTLIEGLAIQIPAMVCQAFNADFDGDQMAVHLPLTREAQAEAAELMSSTHNLLKPATGDPITVPTKDIVMGLFWLTKLKEGLGEGMAFSSSEEVLLALFNGRIDLKSKIKVLKGGLGREIGHSDTSSENSLFETSAGRIIFNRNLLPEYPFTNQLMDKKALRDLVTDIFVKHGYERTREVLDSLKYLGFHYATLSGLSWSMDDLKVPKEKEEILKQAEKEVAAIAEQFSEGLLTNDERRKRVIEVWSTVNDKVSKLVPKTLDPHGPVVTFIESGARGSWAQPNQMSGMKGLVSNPAGEIIELPIKSSFKEGFNVLEYFISTHGGRKGSADTALRTASAGYLTRRLVDVAQDVIIREEDCGDKTGKIIRKADSAQAGDSFHNRIYGRTSMETITVGKETLIKAGEIVDRKTSLILEKSPIESLHIRSVLTCKTRFGICQKCYGYDLGHSRPIQLGEAIGVVAAQAIGEPGTQLTMRTFHTGGVASVVDITQGLPRVEEIFEVRSPRGRAALAEYDGIVESVIDRGKNKIIRIIAEGEVKSKPTRGRRAAPASPRELGSRGGQAKKLSALPEKQIVEYTLPEGVLVWVKEGDRITKGQQLSEGNLDLKLLLKVSGRHKVEDYVLSEVKKIYNTAGESINDKHIEVIVRQMFSRVKIKSGGNSEFLAGDIVDKSRFFDENRKLRAKKLEPSKGIQLIMGITKVALSTESFLSASSFQETSRILISAAMEGKLDPLRGLKENVIIGRLIPAGTGYRGAIKIENPIEEKAEEVAESIEE